MKQKFIRKLRRVSTHSYALVVPKELIDEFRWQERQKLEIVYGGKKHEFVVKDWKK
jgi:bifunctional DNA-binding transcriptional regulator/antitoxin component of YhaV-PrlF toxin-antitoxin module